MKNLTPEMIEKAKAAKSVEELLALAKENNFEMNEEEAKTYFAQLNPKSGELDDDDLDNVAGGGCGDKYEYKSLYPGDRVRILIKCRYCGAENPTGTLTECSLQAKSSCSALVQVDCCGLTICSGWDFEIEDLRKI